MDTATAGRGPARGRGRMRIGLVAALLLGLAGCVSPHRAPATGTASALVAPDDAPLAAWARSVTAPAAVDGASAVQLIADGRAALDTRLALIDEARVGVDLQVYIFGPDRSSEAVSAALARAAARGVRVRLLLDDWGAKPSDRALAALAAQPGVAVRLFNPVATPRLPPLAMLVDFAGTNRRMHNKLLVVDGQVAVVGGRNVGDAYFAAPAPVAFGDLDALVAGPVVGDFARSFDAYWNAPGHAAIVPPDPAAGTSPPSAPTPPAAVDARPIAERLAAGARPLRHGRAVALADPPAKSDQAAAEATSTVAAGLASVAGEPRHSLLVVSPYFVPGAQGVAWLAGLQRRGVAVRVVTNALAATDVPAVHAGYARHRRALLEAGVELHEVRPQPGAGRAGGSGPGLVDAVRRSLHAKVLVIDGRWTFVGSMNLDPRSMRLNTENGLVLDDPATADALARDIAAVLPTTTWRVTLHDGRLRWIEAAGDAPPRVHDGEPEAGRWLRWQATVLSWLPIDALL